MSEKHVSHNQGPGQPGGGEQRPGDEGQQHTQGPGVGAPDPQMPMGGYQWPPYPYPYPHTPHGNPYGYSMMGYGPGHTMPYPQGSAYGPPPSYVQAPGYYAGYYHDPAPSHGGEGMAHQGPGSMAHHAYGNPGAQANPGPGKHAGAGLIDNLMGNDDGLFSNLAETLGMDDKEFWKGALVGAAVVLLLTNESVKSALFKTAAGAKEKVATGASVMKEKVKAGAEAFKEAGAAPQEQGEATSANKTTPTQETEE